MKLYDAMTPNNLRVTVFLAEKAIDVPRERVDILGGGTYTPDFLARNPLGQLPVLELDNGTNLAETMAICRYLEELHPEPNLFGETPEERAVIEMWNRRMELQIFDAIGQVARHTFPFFAQIVEQMPDFAETQVRRLEKNLAWLDAALADRDFVAGARFTVADITGMAVLFVCDIGERPLSPAFANVKRWEERMRARPSFAAQFEAAA